MSLCARVHVHIESMLQGYRSHPGVPSYICLFVWAMVGWVTLPFFSFFLKAGVPCTCISMHACTCVYMLLIVMLVLCGGWCAIIRVFMYGVCRHV